MIKLETEYQVMSESPKQGRASYNRLRGIYEMMLETITPIVSTSWHIGKADRPATAIATPKYMGDELAEWVVDEELNTKFMAQLDEALNDEATIPELLEEHNIPVLEIPVLEVDHADLQGMPIVVAEADDPWDGQPPWDETPTPKKIGKVKLNLRS